MTTLERKPEKDHVDVLRRREQQLEMCIAEAKKEVSKMLELFHQVTEAELKGEGAIKKEKRRGP